MVQARVTSTPTVVGSIPTGGESCRSSVAEHWSVSDQLFPPQKHSGVVKAHVTSGRASRRKLGRSRVRFSLAPQRAIAQAKNTRTVCSRRNETPGWRSAGILLSQRSGDEPPRPWANIPPGLELSGANRITDGGSRRGRGKRLQGWRGS